MRRWGWLVLLAAVVLVLVAVRRVPPRDTQAPVGGAPAPSATSQAPGASPQAPDPAVPVAIPTGEPGLDRALARDYRKALEAQRIKVTALAITDRRATRGSRRADIVYQTSTSGTLDALRPEIARILGPGASPRLALDLITVRAARADGTIAATISVTVPDIDRWLRAQISDDEFYRTWTVRTRPR